MKMFCVKCGVHVTATVWNAPCSSSSRHLPSQKYIPQLRPVQFLPRHLSASVLSADTSSQRLDPCNHCRSVRVVLISVVHDLIGPNWRSTFAEQDTTPPATVQQEPNRRSVGE